MLSSGAWAGISALAEAWRATPIVQTFASELPRNASHPFAPLPTMLQNIIAGAGAVIADPLVLASRMPLAAASLPDVDLLVLQRDHEAWLAAARRVELSHRLTLAWIRSRLPGYPNIHGPHLALGAPLNTDDLTFRLAWQPTKRLLRLVLRLQEPSPLIAQNLEASSVTAEAIVDATIALIEELARSEEWAALDRAYVMSETAVAELRAARDRAAARLTPAAVDSAEPDLALRRAQYRENVIREETATLTSDARAYADAFESLDLTLQLAVSSVFGQLVCYPVETIAASGVEVTPGPPRRVSFETPHHFPTPEPNAVFWLESALVADAVRVNGVSVSFNNLEMTVQVNGTILPGTAAGWGHACP